MFNENLSVFFNTSEHATAITVGGAPVEAIFDSGFAQASVGTAGMASDQPALTLATSQVPADWFRLPVVVPGEPAYTVMAHQPDGTGVSRLLLELSA